MDEYFVINENDYLKSGGNNSENGFKDFMYDNIVPACFLAPMKSTFDMDDAQTFLVRSSLLFA